MTCCQPKNVPTFRPNFRKKALTEKFYARHERLIPNPNYRESYQEYRESIGKRQHSNPREGRFAPLTENQMYGWLIHLAEDYSTGYDPILFRHHYHTSEAIKTQMRIISDLLKDLKHK